MLLSRLSFSVAIICSTAAAANLSQFEWPDLNWSNLEEIFQTPRSSHQFDDDLSIGSSSRGAKRHSKSVFQIPSEIYYGPD